MMRIITGKARGIKLSTLEGDNTRPTSERAKEAVFSMIQFDIEGRTVLDLFAGSGQMGLEALSRGAASAVFVDKNTSAAEIVKTNIKKTKSENNSKVYCGDYKSYLKSSSEKFDIIFLDPPYAERIIPTVLSELFEYGKMKPNSIIVCESAEEDIFENTAELKNKFEIIRTAKYGIAHITILGINEERN